MSNLSPTISMWVFTIIIIIGLIMTIYNITDKYWFSKFDGVILTIIGVFASMITGISTNNSITEIFAGKCN